LAYPFTCGIPRLRRFLSAALLAAFAAALAVPAAGAAVYDPSADPNSMAATTLYTGAQAWWNAGYTGRGVDVAVIDSGVAPVPGLNNPGQVLYGPDL
jgi:serine protease AprX